MSEPGTVIELDRVEDLFSPPPVDQFAGRFEHRSGIELMLIGLRSRPRGSDAKVHFIIRRPTAITAGEVRAAIRGYFASMVTERRFELQRVRRVGRQVLLFGLGVLAICLLLSAGIKTWQLLPEFARDLFGEGFVIAGWVSLWRPLEYLIFEPIPLRSDLRLYEVAGRADIEVTLDKQ